MIQILHIPKINNESVPSKHSYKSFFVCVGATYSGEYDVYNVTLSVYPHRASLKNMPGHGGYTLRVTS
jgi:hypothetical protein